MKRRKDRVRVEMDREDWELLRETLLLDAASAAFDRGLRDQLRAALGRVLVLDI